MLSHIPAALPSTAHRPSVVGVRGQQGSKQLIEKKKCSEDRCCLHPLGEAISDNRSLSLVWGAGGAGQRKILLAPKLETGFC